MLKPELTEAAEVFAQELEKIETALEASKADVEKLLRENGTLKMDNEALQKTQTTSATQDGLPHQVSYLQYVFCFRQKPSFLENAQISQHVIASTHPSENAANPSNCYCFSVLFDFLISR